MPFKTKEQKAEYDRKYKIKNKEKLQEQRKIFYLENKEKVKEYELKNKEKIKERRQKYSQTEKGKRSQRIGTWKQRGLIGDCELIYKIYKSTKYCDNCGFELNTGDNRMRKCMDHSHITGEFRNILCHACNSKIN
tara:strand:+ start:284 stop:688 length:405 start_codon:yes stop_codon:yes gene_type:complete